MHINSLSNPTINSIHQPKKATSVQTSDQVVTPTSVQNAYSVKLGTQPIQTGTYGNPTKQPMITTSKAS